MASLDRAPFNSHLSPSCHHQTSMQWNGHAMRTHCGVWRRCRIRRLDTAMKSFTFQPCYSGMVCKMLWIGSDCTNTGTQWKSNMHTYTPILQALVSVHRNLAGKRGGLTAGNGNIDWQINHSGTVCMCVYAFVCVLMCFWISGRQWTCVCMDVCVSLLTLTAPYESNSNFRESVIQTQLAARDYPTLQLTVSTVSALQLSIERTLINHLPTTAL